MNYLLLLSATSCTINGRPGTPEECSRFVKNFLGIGIAIFIPIILLILIFVVWWLVTLIHAITHEDVPDRILWIVLHLIIGAVVAPVYYFAVQRPYNKNKDSTNSGISDNTSSGAKSSTDGSS